MLMQAREALERHHGDIASAVGALRPCFAADSAEVQREWLRYTEKVRTPPNIHITRQNAI